MKALSIVASVLQLVGILVFLGALWVLTMPALAVLVGGVSLVVVGVALERRTGGG